MHGKDRQGVCNTGGFSQLVLITPRIFYQYQSMERLLKHLSHNFGHAIWSCYFPAKQQTVDYFTIKRN